MSYTEIRIDALSEILENLGIAATSEQVTSIEKDFSYHIEMEREMDSHQFAGRKEVCSECESLKIKLKDLQYERDIYHDSVCKRRNTNQVWIENGEVKYNL